MPHPLTPKRQPRVAWRAAPQGPRHRGAFRVVLALLLATGLTSACATTPSAGGRAGLDRSLSEALRLYEGGEYVRAAHAFRSAGDRARLMRLRDKRGAALVSECTAWLRAERMTEFGSCTQRLAVLEWRTPGRDRSVNTLIALGAIAGGRSVPTSRVPAPVGRLIRKAAEEGV